MTLNGGNLHLTQVNRGVTVTFVPKRKTKKVFQQLPVHFIIIFFREKFFSLVLVHLSN